MPLDVLDHDDGVVDDDTDRQHQSEQRQRVDREPRREHHREGADDGDWYRDERDDRGPPRLQKENDHDDDHQRSEEQRVDHLADRIAHEQCRIVHGRPFDALREPGLQVGHLRANGAGERQRVRARRLEHHDGDGRLVVEQRAQAERAGTELDARNIAQTSDRSVSAGLDDDVAELFLVRESTARDDRQLICHRVVHRRSADGAGGDLEVLLANRVDDVARRQSVRCDTVRIEPDAHCIVARAEHDHLTRAGNSRQLVADVQQRIIAEIDRVVAAVRRKQVHDHRDVRGALLGDDTESAHFLGQSRQRLGHAVLHLHLREVDVRADLEGDGEIERAVGRGGRCHVEHPLDAVDRVLERRAHRLCEHRRIRARIYRANRDGRRRDFGILADRQLRDSDQATGKNDQRQHDREDRAVDKKA